MFHQIQLKIEFFIAKNIFLDSFFNAVIFFRGRILQNEMQQSVCRCVVNLCALKKKKKTHPVYTLQANINYK